MAAPKHMFLPEMTGGITEPPEAGVWHGYPRGVLRTLSDGIGAGAGADVRGVSSVPDAWARPLMFQNALRPGSGHPMRTRFVQEWRGLLSLLALHAYHGYPVDFAPVSLGDAGAAKGPARDFVRALVRLLPAPVALEREVAYRWSDTLLVRYRPDPTSERRIPLGAFSPSTLVYTAADYAPRLRDVTLNLKDANGFLAPPAAGQSDDLLYVREWVEQLRQRLNARRTTEPAVLDTASDDPTARDAVTTINALLDEWIAELRGVLKDERGNPLTTADVEVAPTPADVEPAPAFLEQYRVYRELLRPLQTAPTASGASQSNLLLKPRRNRSGRDHVVVVTPGLIRSGGRIWGSSRLSQLGGDAARVLDQHFHAKEGWGETFAREDLRPANAIWIRPERYFLTDAIASTPDGGALLAADWQALNGEQTYLLPFTARVLDFFAPDEVRDVLRPEFRRVERGVEFSFSLPVADRTERIKKVYRDANPGPNEGAVVRLDVPPVQIFPRYVDANWRRYYVFQGGAERVAVRPVVPATCQVAERTHASPTSKVTARAVEIAGDGAFPEALVFAPAGQADATLGLALVPRPPEPPGLSGQWRIGVDFGTSNTNVFRLRDAGSRDASSIAERWRFGFDRYLHDVTAAPAATRDAQLREFFVPPEAVELPIPTALRVFADAQKSHAFLDYSIFFSSAYEIPRNVHTDIKWDEEEDNTKPFLKSLLFLLLVEVGLEHVRKVTLACSYPKAFSLTLRTHYERTWESVAKELIDDPVTAVFRRRQLGGVGGAEVAALEFETEGRAAGEFFASEMTIPDRRDRANKEIAAVCLDVGGGTTDISIWHRGQIVFDSSVLLAGRQISRLLQQHPRVLEVLFSPEAARALAQKCTDAKAFAALLNVVQKREEALTRERLIDRANSREVQWLRRVLVVEFGAIAFYTASLLGAVNRATGGQLAGDVEGRAIKLHWGGNAAKLMHWIDFGRYDEAGIASKMLNALLFNALKDVPIKVPPAMLAQKQSPGHKSEAAGGLVVIHAAASGGGAAGRGRGPDREYVMEDESAPAAGEDDGGLDMPGDVSSGARSAASGPDVVAGENITLTTGPVGHLDLISGRDLFDRGRTRFQATSLDRLRRFVDILNYFGVGSGLLTNDSRIVLDRDMQGKIGDDVIKEFVAAERLPEGQRLIEPVFITEVKILLDLLRSELR